MAKLIALDVEDLLVISAHIQDAVTNPSKMIFDADSNSVVMEMNRFAWEKIKPSWNPFRRNQNQRKNCILHIGRVNRIAAQNINQKANDNIISLLAITFEFQDAPAGCLELKFADNKTLRLDVECLEVKLSDMGGAWAAQRRPNHGI